MLLDLSLVILFMNPSTIYSRSFFVDPKTWQVDAILGSFFKIPTFRPWLQEEVPITHPDGDGDDEVVDTDALDPREAVEREPQPQG